MDSCIRLVSWPVGSSPCYVIAEPMKRLGRFTFADALDAKFVHAVFRAGGWYQHAGSGASSISFRKWLRQVHWFNRLLNFPHWAGVMMVGTVVILIVVPTGWSPRLGDSFLKGTLWSSSVATNRVDC